MNETELKALFPSISNGLNSLSVASSLIVLVSFLIVALINPKLTNRTTLRLQVAISLFDFLNATFALFHHSVKEEGSFCTFIGFWRDFGEQMYCFLNIAIAVNLQLIFLHKFTPKKYWEYLYWSLSLGTAFLLGIIPLGLSFYGVASNNLCYMKDSDFGAKIMIFFNTSLIFIATFIYLLVISILVAYKLFKERKNTDDHLFGVDGKDKESTNLIKLTLRKLIIRISLYPLATLIGLSGFIVGYIILVFKGYRVVGISLWGMVGITTKGFINMITFFLDPTFQNALYSTYYKLSGKNNVYENNKDEEVYKLSNIFNINEEENNMDSNHSQENNNILQIEQQKFF